MRRFVQAFSSISDLPASWPSAMRAVVGTCPDHYNLGKGDEAWVLRHVGGILTATRMRWGLIPRWSKTPETSYTTITARLERAARSRIFGKPWQTQRCLIPMTGYYKWDRSVRPPIPHFIQAQDGHVLCAAGLWERWEQDEAEDPPFESFTILTHPNAVIPAPLTPDGPVFVEGTAAKNWLSGPSMLAGHTLRRSKTPALGSYPVSHAYRDRARSDYTLIEPRAASNYLEPEPDAFHDGSEDDD